jgi:hypothetical protein
VNQNANYGLSAVDRAVLMGPSTWARYEYLPPEIRAALQQANGPWSIDSVEKAYYPALGAATRAGIPKAVVVDLYVNAFEAQQAGEVELTSTRHAALYGKPLPHVAAGATVLRERVVFCEACKLLPLSAPGAPSGVAVVCRRSYLME